MPVMVSVLLGRLRSFRTVGLAASLLLHLLCIQHVMLGSAPAKKPAPEDGGPGASAMANDDGNAMTLVMVNMPSESQESPEEDISSAGSAESDLMIQVASSDPAPLLAPEQFESDEVDEDASAKAGDPAIQSKLFGSYTSQIDARIQRAWQKPRTPIWAADKNSKDGLREKTFFSCQARISQDIHGSVTEVELLDCDRDPEWQMSLVNAIQRASPLPAPPSPTVFTNTLTLYFEGRTYTPGYREDEYEQASSQVALTGYSR